MEAITRYYAANARSLHVCDPCHTSNRFVATGGDFGEDRLVRVLFSSRPGFGHLYPMMPLALALREQGHDVVFAVGAGFVERLRDLGFEAHGSGPTIQWAEEEALRRDPSLGKLPPEKKPRLGAAIFAELLPPEVARDVLRVAESSPPAMVVYEGSDFGAAVAAGALGVPAVLHAYGIPWPAAMLDLVRPPLDALAARYGLGARAVDPLLGDVYLDVAPPSLGDAASLGPPRRLRLRAVPYSEPVGELPPTDGGRPTAYVTLGTVMNEREDIMGTVAAELAGLGYDVIVATGREERPDDRLGRDPRIRVVPFVRQDRLLASVDLVASHCGSGTMLGALGHGVPQLAIPQGADQFLNASAVERSGAGLALMPDAVSAAGVRAAARRLRDEPAFARRARAVRDEIAAMPSPADVAAELAAMV